MILNRLSVSYPWVMTMMRLKQVHMEALSYGARGGAFNLCNPLLHPPSSTQVGSC